MSARVAPQQLAADYGALVVEPALSVIRNLLLQHRPPNVGEYICQHCSQIRNEIEAAAFADAALASSSGGAAAAACESDQSEASQSAVCFSGSPSTAAAAVKRPASLQSQDGSLAKKSTAHGHVDEESSAAGSSAPLFSSTLLSSTLLSSDPLSSISLGSIPRTSSGSDNGGKFDTFVMPSGKMEDFHKGLASRIGFPHLEFEKTMEAEHCSMAGCDMSFTTRNYGITTTAKAEWGVVVRGEKPPPEHMLNGRVMVSVEEKLLWINEQFAAKGLDVKLRREEVIAVVLYTGPMYMLYNCVLAQWSDPGVIWKTLYSGNNLFTTTLSVLVSAVQKLSSITAIPDGPKLYRGTGGRFRLPEHFSQPDEFNCRGMTEWGFMSCSADKEVAMGYSGAAEGRPHAIVLEIEPSCVDRGAVVSEFSQYPMEAETMFLPMSFVAPRGERRVERSAKGDAITVVPVRVSVNLKAERLEQLEEKKRTIHLTGFEFRVNEVRQRLQRLADEGGAEVRLKTDRDRLGMFWEKPHSVEGFVSAQVAKVEAVLSRHRARAAAEYSDDDVYRRLVTESLEAARMAESALLWWLRDRGQYIHHIEDYSLLCCQRSFESFLALECRRADGQGGHRAAAVKLCRSRNLLRVFAFERDENGETPLIALAARGGSADDVHLLVAAGADVGAVTVESKSAMHFAAEQGHAEVVEALARAGADCNQTDADGRTSLDAGSFCGHLRCVEVLLKEGADVNKARHDGVTPLFIASQNGHPDVVDALLGGKADANMARHDGVTPLFIASSVGHWDVVDALLGGKADVNKARHNGVTPLFIASQYGYLDVVDALLGGDADVNKARHDGVTPLFVASQSRHLQVVEALVRAGADLTLACGGQTPYSVARFYGDSDIVAVLETAAPEVARQQAQHYDRIETEHAAAIELHCSTGCVVVNRHRGRGIVTSDYELQLQEFSTLVADVRLCGGCFYFELQIIDLINVVQFGFCTQGFEPRTHPEGEGAGDDAWSWAVDGVRMNKWHDGPIDGDFGSVWVAGDVIGFALDMRSAGIAVMSVSVNGSFGAPNGVAFSDMNAPFLSPAFTGDGRYRVNFGDRPFAHAPPDGDHTSVHDFHRQQQQQ